jgi:hypothetical protein
MEQLGAEWITMEQFGAVWSSTEQYGALWSRLEQLGAEWRTMEQLGALWIRIELVLKNCCRCDAPSSVAAEVVAGVVCLLLCPLLNLSFVSSRFLNSLALPWFLLL